MPNRTDHRIDPDNRPTMPPDGSAEAFEAEIAKQSKRHGASGEWHARIARLAEIAGVRT